MGYINGSLGEVVGFEEDDDFGILPKVKLTDGTVLVVEPETWSVDNDADKTIASFQQIPLPFGMGHHHSKSQGMTLAAAEINLSHTLKKDRVMWLCRLKTLEGLRLFGF